MSRLKEIGPWLLGVSGVIAGLAALARVRQLGDEVDSVFDSHYRFIARVEAETKALIDEVHRIKEHIGIKDQPPYYK